MAATQFHRNVAVGADPAHDVGVGEVIDVTSCFNIYEVWDWGVVEANRTVACERGRLWREVVFVRSTFVLAMPDAVFDFASFWGGFGLGDGVRAPAEGVPVCVVVKVTLVVVRFGCWDLVEVLSHFSWDPML